MSLVGMTGLGGYGAASGMRFSSTRGRMQGSPFQGVAYPSPFFDVAHTYLPVTIKQMFRWTRYYFLTFSLVNATVFKLAEYPITDILIDHDNSELAKQWLNYFQEQLEFRAFQVEFGLDYFVYGNGFASISYPFKKYLTCRTCGHYAPASKLENHWVFTNHEFRLTCPHCGAIGPAKVNDYYFRNPSGIKLIRWNPEDIEISYNDITGEYTYFYTIPSTIRSDISLGKKDIVANLPQVFIEAVRQQKGIVLSKDNLFHMKRPTLAGKDRGWGIPIMLPVLKDVFYMQVMKKAQEAILLEHIVPLRVLFPQAGSGTSDPYTTINLHEWRDHIAQEIAHWRFDNNYIPILPLPIGNQTIGGDGRALLLSGEIQQWSEHIMMGMGVPREFLQGGLSYAGTNVSMRMLENSFIGYIIRHKAFANWVMKSISSFLKWPEATVRFKPFKMADDLQRKAYRFQLNQAQKLSDTTLLADDDLDQEEENAIMERETASRLQATKMQQLAMAEIQGEQQVIMMKYQAKAQQEQAAAAQAPNAPGEPGGAEVMDQGAPGGQAVEDQGAPGGPAQGQAPPPPTQGQPMAGPPPQEAQSPLNAGQRMQAGQSGAVDIPTMAYGYAQQIAALPPDQQQMAIEAISAQSPELANLVIQMLQQMGISLSAPADSGMGAAGTAATEVNMTPMPDKLPPRRAAG